MDEKLQNFFDEVLLKYNLYNGLFLELPFEGTGKAGSLLANFSRYIEEETGPGDSPVKIVEGFFAKYVNEEESQDSILFKMLQFVERQVVLFDALEDSAFSLTRDLAGIGTLQHLLVKVADQKKKAEFLKQLEEYRIRIVLTAHPTQFYPESVLTISNQLIPAFHQNDLKRINELLLQMGKTSFKHKQKPSPFQEAQSLVWYLENTLYPMISSIQETIEKSVGKELPPKVEIGFWPGGDRDGNPFVTADVTLGVARLLKTRILRLYIKDAQILMKKFTFTGVLEALQKVFEKLQNTHLATQTSVTPEGDIYSTPEQLLHELGEINTLLVQKHNSLFLESFEVYERKVRCFGFHFALMDMREDSSIIREDPSENTLNSIQAIKEIQKENGAISLSRFILSNTQSAGDILRVCELVNEIPVDIIPLFETIDDLEKSTEIMGELYNNQLYRKRLEERNNKQTIMLGFSDGTKDGGYVTANWEIYQAKIRLTSQAKKVGIELAFFDGRGGPPGRGGGNTHAFYRSLGSRISHRYPQLTVQGQTIGVSFGTKESAKYNIEQLFTAALEDLVFPDQVNDLTLKQSEILQQLSSLSLEKYTALKNDPLFVPYLERMTPLRFFGELNVGSRPTTRKKEKEFSFSDLRAIPFVGSWSQLKQNIPGFYGLGTALNTLVTQGRKEELKELYEDSLFFKTLIDNAMMSLLKTNFLLTLYMKKDEKFGSFWEKLKKEADLTEQLLLTISNQKELLENDPLNRESVRLREAIVHPLLIVQQYAMIRMVDQDNPYKKMVIKALSANTNASRNSA